MQSSSSWLSTGRLKSSRRRTARVVASSSSIWAISKFMSAPSPARVARNLELRE